MDFGRRLYFKASLFFRGVAHKFFDFSEQIFMFEHKYEPEDKDNFLKAFHDIILFTYRIGFKDVCVTEDMAQQLKNRGSYLNNTTSDLGWGCMYRVTQMSITHGIRQFLKRHLSDLNIESIIGNFQDNEIATFSIHNMVKVGFYEFGVKPTSWIGPTTSSMIADKLINDNKHIISNIQVGSIAYIDGTIYKNQAVKHFSEMNSESCTFVWLCMKLGSSKFNISAYKKTIISMSSIPQFICIMGGNNYSSSGLLIVAFSDTFLYCLDPHIKLLPIFSEQKNSKDEFIQKIPTRIYWEELSPSLSIVYVCRNLQDFDSLCNELRRINSDLFEVVNNFEIEANNRMEFDSGFLIV